MDIPQVQVAGPGDSQDNQGPSNSQNANVSVQDVEMNQAPVQEDPTEATPDLTPADVQSSEPHPDPKPVEEQAPPKRKPGLQFLDFLTSPIVELVVGAEEKKTVLTAHQSLLLESPMLAEAVERFDGSGPRRIELPDENVEAFGYFLQFQYTRDYSASPVEATEQETTAGEIDECGEQLLKHARVYTLAEKLGIPSLKTLAHSKIHRINSTPHGEIIYARYVYTNTPISDITIRKPVASFWALRSHVLRHEAEEEFKKLCLDVPEFCFDVLSLVLDHKEKRAQDKAEADSNVKGSGRKRLRSGV